MTLGGCCVIHLNMRTHSEKHYRNHYRKPSRATRKTARAEWVSWNDGRKKPSTFSRWRVWKKSGRPEEAAYNEGLLP